MENENEFIRTLINRAGGTQTKLAEIAGVSQNAVNKWLHNQSKPGASATLRMEAAGLATRHQINPEIYPD